PAAGFAASRVRRASAQLELARRPGSIVPLHVAGAVVSTYTTAPTGGGLFGVVPMIASASPSRGTPAPDTLHARFLALVPRIVTHAQIAFRGVRCPSRKEDLIAETLGLCWVWFGRLAARGRDPGQFVSALAGFASRAACCGRRVAGQESANDVLSERAQARHGFTVERLPAALTAPYEQLYGTVGGQRLHDVFEERLRDNRTTPILDQVQFKIDFRAW